MPFGDSCGKTARTVVENELAIAPVPRRDLLSTNKESTSAIKSCSWRRPDDLGAFTQMNNANEYLTKREREILALIGHGKTTKEIAAALGVSTDTIANHRKSICKKTNIHSTAGLAAFAAIYSNPQLLRNRVRIQS
jgi:DNA-binding CsgD family transcriptional regulator